jgi:hypothetical protein
MGNETLWDLLEIALDFIDSVADEGSCECEDGYECRSCEAAALSERIGRSSVWTDVVTGKANIE